jgi:hypothetical protein
MAAFTNEQLDSLSHWFCIAWLIKYDSGYTAKFITSLILSAIAIGFIAAAMKFFIAPITIAASAGLLPISLLAPSLLVLGIIFAVVALVLLGFILVPAIQDRKAEIRHVCSRSEQIIYPSPKEEFENGVKLLTATLNQDLAQTRTISEISKPRKTNPAEEEILAAIQSKEQLDANEHRENSIPSPLGFFKIVPSCAESVCKALKMGG